ncbi:MAG: hypothetical protein IJC45_01220 [Clostridia bacterium]|nr:hypothetical protein [Clostridia bacterium]
MAFENLRNTASFLRENLRVRKENRRPGQRNYMKTKHSTDAHPDPAYRDLLEKAPSKKAPFAEKTKGFYRFSETFPDRVDAEGYRINEQNRKTPMSRKTIIAATLAFLLLFSAAFVLTDAALFVSDLPPESTQYEQDNSLPAVDSNFGEVGTLPFVDDLVQPTDPTDPFMQEATLPSAGEEVTQVPQEPVVTVPAVSVPENTTAFSQAPVEDGQFTRPADGWN